MTEQDYEKLFNIQTSGEQKVFNDSLHYNRYEATSYYALDLLFENYKLKSSDSIVDFGCGMGRLNFYINYFFKSQVIGIEMNKYYYQISLDNKINYLNKNKRESSDINFVNCFAEKYKIDKYNNKFYFFNPFSLQIFTKVIDNILISLEQHPRSIDLILYYASEDYIYYLENNTAFTLKEKIILPNKYKHNPRETFLIYNLNYYIK